MRKISVQMILIILLALTTQCKSKKPDTDKVQEKFAYFDSLYIPTLVLTNGNDYEKAKKAITRLYNEWHDLQIDFLSYYPKDGNWNEAVDIVDQQISLAFSQVEENEDLHDIHQILEKIRYTFYNARKEKNIIFYQDFLTDYHDTMEKIVRYIEHNKNTDFTDTTILDLLELTKKLKKTHSILMQHKFEPQIYHFNETKTQKLQQAINMQEKSLTDLEITLQNKNKEEILKAVKTLKPGYVAAFKLFGDF